jgi:hypothetical protein
MTRAEYSVALTRALHQVTLSHPVYAVLIVLRSGGPAAVSETAASLGLGYHAVVWHVRKYPDLFSVHKETVPLKVAITPEGEELLHKIESLVARYAQDAAEPRRQTLFRPARSLAAETPLPR